MGNMMLLPKYSAQKAAIFPTICYRRFVRIQII